MELIKGASNRVVRKTTPDQKSHNMPVSFRASASFFGYNDFLFVGVRGAEVDES